MPSSKIISVDSSIWNSISHMLLVPSHVNTKTIGVPPNSRSQVITETDLNYKVFMKALTKGFFIHANSNFLSHATLIPVFTGICSQCYSDELRIICRDSVVVCTACGFVLRDQIIQDEEANALMRSFPKIPKLERHHALDHHKRKNHFKFWLLRIQGKENCKIKLSELEVLKSYMESRYSYADGCEYYNMRQALRNLHMQKYYHHIYYLIKTIYSKTFVDLSSYHEEILVDMFVTIQRPFSENRNGRVNMLSYTYILRKFTEILGWTAVSRGLPRQKSTAKIADQDKIWKNICSQVGFKFIRSIL